MDPQLSEVVDYHGRRFGAPTELVALLGPGRSQVVTDGLDQTWIAALPSDRISLVGQLGGMLVVRRDECTTVIATLAGGHVSHWRGQPGRLTPTDNDEIELEDLGLLWRLLDDMTTMPVGTTETILSEITGRALLVDILGQAIITGGLDHVDDAIGAFASGSLTRLARLAGLPKPPARLHAGYARDCLVFSGHQRVPIPTGRSSTDLRALHRAVPKRWEIAADLAEILGSPHEAKRLLACSPTWTASAA